MKKGLAGCAAAVLLLWSAPAFALPTVAAASQPVQAGAQTAVEAPVRSSSTSSASRSVVPGEIARYHSGFRSSSSRLRSAPWSTGRYSGSYGTRTGSLFGYGTGSHLFSFGTGFLLGSMFHPFGGYYGLGYHSFSLIGLVFDLVILYIIWRIVRRFFR
ncbi:MAG: hypothetical protein K6T78_11190 [Alicyclobacillus sp.]|nr:hypothetical protein [Alicyclobacillus sp.]